MKCAKCKNGQKIAIRNNFYFCSVKQMPIYECNVCEFYKGKNKYNAKKVVTDVGRFDSKKEANRFFELDNMQKQGLIKNLECQKRFELVPKTKDERAVFYVADFVYEENGQKIAEDVKSQITKKNPTYILKRKLFKYKYTEYVFVEK